MQGLKMKMMRMMMIVVLLPVVEVEVVVSVKVEVVMDCNADSFFGDSNDLCCESERYLVDHIETKMLLVVRLDRSSLMRYQNLYQHRPKVVWSAVKVWLLKFAHCQLHYCWYQ